MDALPHAAKKIIKPFFRSKDEWPAPAPFVSPRDTPRTFPAEIFSLFFLPPGAAVRILCSVVPAVERREMVLLPQARPGMLAAPPVPLRSAKQRGERGTRRGGTAGVQLLVFSSFSVCSWQERRVNSPVQSALHLK